MLIMLVEDRGSVSQYLTDVLEEEDHEVIHARSILVAKDLFKKHKVELDLIIVDLHMKTEGLTDDEKEKSFDGRLSGWFWLKRIVIDDKKFVHEKKLIIYTDYSAYLRENVDKKEYEGITIIEKGGTIYPAKELLKKVRSINKKRK